MPARSTLPGKPDHKVLGAALADPRFKDTLG
jgi:hypothetical protein